MVRQRGYTGSVIQVRRLVRRLRPETGRTVYRRVVTLAGEEAQVDWGSFGKVHIGAGTRTVSGFVMMRGRLHSSGDASRASVSADALRAPGRRGPPRAAESPRRRHSAATIMILSSSAWSAGSSTSPDG